MDTLLMILCGCGQQNGAPVNEDLQMIPWLILIGVCAVAALVYLLYLIGKD